MEYQRVEEVMDDAEEGALWFYTPILQLETTTIG
jgi:hypothetical protein